MMKKTMLFFAVALLVCAGSAQAVPTLLVELGTPASEVMYGVNTSGPGGAGTADWGSYVGPPSGGYGNISTDPLSYDNTCRMVWGGGGGAYDQFSWAEIVFPVAVESVTIRHLDGSGNDSFDVHVDGNLWGHYEGNQFPGEVWTLDTYSGTPGSTLKITVTADPWSGFQTWGQLGIDRVEATPVPVPGAVLLCSIGAGLVGWVRRRRSF
ncbi:MAG: hypothetical protein JW720_05605 [Sedimentisphaerales bacterium]|nr:hypothetical protein [Sedimentisphaerales bacterium]